MTPTLEPVDPAWEARVRASFNAQRLMDLLGATLTALAPGRCEISLPWRPELTQQDGFFHAGIVTTIADNAAGFAAFTLMPADARVLTVELKINLLSPAKGERAIARGSVLRAGRTLTVTRADIVTVQAGKEVPVAALQATMIALRQRTFGPDVGSLVSADGRE